MARSLNILTKFKIIHVKEAQFCIYFTATLHDHMVGEEYMADYLLFHLNQTAQFDYVSYMKLDEPMDDARLMLAMTAVYQGMVKQARDMDTGEKNS